MLMKAIETLDKEKDYINKDFIKSIMQDMEDKGIEHIMFTQENGETFVMRTAKNSNYDGFSICHSEYLEDDRECAVIHIFNEAGGIERVEYEE